MTIELNKDIAEAVDRQGHPLEVRDAAGRVYVVTTGQQFRKYVYDDSELTPDEMLAAAAVHLDDPEGWGGRRASTLGMTTRQKPRHERCTRRRWRPFT